MKFQGHSTQIHREDKAVISQQEITQVNTGKKIYDIEKQKRRQEEQAEAQKEFLSLLLDGNIDVALEIAEEFFLSQEFITSKKVAQAVQKLFLSILLDGDIKEALEIVDKFPLSQEFITSKKVAEVVQKKFLSCLSSWSGVSDAFRIAENFSLEKEFVKESAQKMFITKMSSGHMVTAIQILEKFSLSKDFLESEEVKSLMQKKFLSYLLYKDVGDALNLAKKLPFTQEFLHSEQVVQAVQKEFIRRLAQVGLDEALEIVSKFSLSQKFILETFQNEFLSTLSNGYIDEEMVNKISLSQEFLKSKEITYAAQKGFLSRLLRGHRYNALGIAKRFSLTQEFLSSEKVVKAVQNEFISNLSKGDILTAFEIADEFSINQEFLNSKEVEAIIVSIGLSYNYKRLNEIYSQDRFGGNLLSFFKNFDIISKKAVTKVLHIDEEVDKDIDRRSIEYRKKAQESLVSFGYNKEVLADLEDEGIDVDAWLNYGAVDYFDLGSADNLSFGEKIQQPVERLPESLAAFMKSIMGAVEEYKGELVNKTIHEDLSLVEKEISRLEALRDNEQDEKKRQGMAKGIVQLRLRLAMPKEIRVWDKLHAEISKLNKLAKEIGVTNESLMAEEKSFLSNKEGVTLEDSLAQKKLVLGIKKKLTSHLNIFKFKLDEFFVMYGETLTLAIGKDRSDGVMQQIEGEIQEHRSHLHSDFETIFSFIGEEKDTEDITLLDQETNEDDEVYKPSARTKSLLEGRSMSIRVGGRSRQDLYLGNYTKCCICIDSEFHEAESPIADYVTDLGMQNVIIYDEITKTPIACAWCWLGKDEETSEIAFVVDNIEGWEKYTINFRSQLEKRLKDYLESYAKKVNVGIFSQGFANNDLHVVEVSEQVKRYRKIGITNRPGGYFLEAELKDGDDEDGFEDDDYDEGLEDE